MAREEGFRAVNGGSGFRIGGAVVQRMCGCWYGAAGLGSNEVARDMPPATMVVVLLSIFGQAYEMNLSADLHGRVRPHLKIKQFGSILKILDLTVGLYLHGSSMLISGIRMIWKKFSPKQGHAAPDYGKRVQEHVCTREILSAEGDNAAFDVLLGENHVPSKYFVRT